VASYWQLRVDAVTVESVDGPDTGDAAAGVRALQCQCQALRNCHSHWPTV